MTERETFIAYGRRIYLSGPVSGMPNYNWDAFDEACQLLRGAQAEQVFNPVAASCNRDGLLVELHEPRFIWADFMACDMRHLLATDWQVDGPKKMHFDCLVRLPGWEVSSGARIESAVAEACGIERVDWGGIEEDVRTQFKAHQESEW